MDEMAYVRILRDLGEDADKTQTQIADVLGTSQTMYARYERGANELPIHHLITLSKYYGVSTDYLLGLSKEWCILTKRSAAVWAVAVCVV